MAANDASGQRLQSAPKKKGVKIKFRESYESKTYLLNTYFHVTVHFPDTIHIQ